MAMLPAMAAAQAGGDGGQLLTFGISPELTAIRNGETDISSRIGFSAAFSDETRSESFNASVNGGYRWTDGNSDWESPRARVAYSRTAADAALELSVDWTRLDFEQLRDPSVFINDDGVLVLPDDLNDLTATGRRTSVVASANLAWNRTAPVSYSLSATLADVSYAGAIAETETDLQTLTVSAGAALQLNDVQTARLNLTSTTTEDEAGNRDQRWSLSGNFDINRPAGSLTLGANLREADGGTRVDLNISRGFETRGQALTFGAGVSRAPDGAVDATGQVNWRAELPRGQVNLAAQRNFAIGAEGDDRRVTTLSAGLSQQLTPLISANLSLALAELQQFDSKEQTASLSASAAYRLDQDWSLRAGTEVIRRRGDGAASPRVTTAFIALDRSFSWRP